MSVIQITKENFENEVLNSEKTVLLDFYADWCGPCRMVAPIVEAISEEHPEYKIGKINVDEQGELANAFSINAIPALIVFKNGQEAAKYVGYCKRDKILSLLA
jgi:thioredoxin 1